MKKKQIKKLEDRIIKIEEMQFDFMREMLAIVSRVQKNNKADYAWTLRQDEVEMIEEGKKVIKIRKILT